MSWNRSARFRGLDLSSSALSPILPHSNLCPRPNLLHLVILTVQARVSLQALCLSIFGCNGTQNTRSIVGIHSHGTRYYSRNTRPPGIPGNERVDETREQCEKTSHKGTALIRAGVSTIISKALYLRIFGSGDARKGVGGGGVFGERRVW